MHVRRSLLAFLVGGILLLSLTLIIWDRSSYNPVFRWSRVGWTASEHPDLGVADGPLDLGKSWPEPEPGDDTLRKNPPQELGDSDANTLEPVKVSSQLLRSRLQSLLDAPVLAHSEAIVKNEEACSRQVANKQVNQDQLKNNRDIWIAVSKTDIRSRRKAIVQHLEQLEKEGSIITGVESGTGDGRGVVMTAGNKNTAQSALVTLRMLRLEYKSSLPVQIFSFPEEIRDQAVIDEFHELGATHHELTGLRKVAGLWKNFHLKAAAILASSFAEVLYLDSDNVPLRDPAYLFDEVAYKDSGGAVFWPDYNKDHPDNAIWRVLGRSCAYTEWEVESGQILIDKRGNDGLNLAALHIASHMQVNHDFWFLLSGGDKDTFRYAFWALGMPYLAAPRWLSALGSASGRDTVWQEGKFCGFVMLQYDIAKNERGQHLPLFLHANLLKHRNDGWQPKQRRLFQTIKRASQDDANEPSLDRATVSVYQDGGMCVDLGVMAASDNAVGAGQEQRLMTEQFSEVYGGVFREFEEQWIRSGGKQGGF